jgi:hypothetical protein
MVVAPAAVPAGAPAVEMAPTTRSREAITAVGRVEMVAAKAATATSTTAKAMVMTSTDRGVTMSKS